MYPIRLTLESNGRQRGLPRAQCLHRRCKCSVDHDSEAVE